MEPDSPQNPLPNPSVASTFLKIEKVLAEELLKINYSATGISFIYNPVQYAAATHEQFVVRFSKERKDVLLVGMNPGPWGMVQTGVPFGEVSIVRDWLGIFGEVEKPTVEHPKRPIDGFNCTRTEISGQRFWGFLRDLAGTPENLFRNLFMYNYSPLSFMKESGKNVTPPEMKIEERKMLMSLCDAALLEVLQLLQPKIIICVGKFVEKQVLKVTKTASLPVKVGLLMHPSPINPKANKGWGEEARKTFDALGVTSLVQGEPP